MAVEVHKVHTYRQTQIAVMFKLQVTAMMSFNFLNESPAFSLCILCPCFDGMLSNMAFAWLHLWVGIFVQNTFKRWFMCRTDISYSFSLSLYISRQNMKTRDNKNNNKMHKTLLKHNFYWIHRKNFVLTKEHMKYLLVGVKSQKSNMNEQVRQSFPFLRVHMYLCSSKVIGKTQQ